MSAEIQARQCPCDVGGVFVWCGCERRGKQTRRNPPDRQSHAYRRVRGRVNGTAGLAPGLAHSPPFGLAPGAGFVFYGHGSSRTEVARHCRGCPLDNSTSVLSIRWWGFLRLGRNRQASNALPRLHPFGDMAMSKEPTYEDAKEIVDKHDEAVNPKGLRRETNQASGVVMKSNPVDPSILTYDPKDVEYDEEVRKQAEKARKDEDKK